MTFEQGERLHQLAWPAWQLRYETRDGGRGCLFGDAQHLGAVMFGGSDAGQQQRSAAGDNQALAMHSPCTGRPPLINA